MKDEVLTTTYHTRSSPGTPQRQPRYSLTSHVRRRSDLEAKKSHLLIGVRSQGCMKNNTASIAIHTSVSAFTGIPIPPRGRANPAHSSSHWHGNGHWRCICQSQSYNCEPNECVESSCRPLQNQPRIVVTSNSAGTRTAFTSEELVWRKRGGMEESCPSRKPMWLGRWRVLPKANRRMRHQRLRVQCWGVEEGF